MAIWVVLALMTGAAGFALLLPLSRRAVPAAAGAGGPQAGAVATETGFYRDQLDEIARDESRGLIAGAEAKAARSGTLRKAGSSAVPPLPLVTAKSMSPYSVTDD